MATDSTGKGTGSLPIILWKPRPALEDPALCGSGCFASVILRAMNPGARLVCTTMESTAGKKLLVRVLTPLGMPNNST
jgi:hypothetical protein